MIKNDTFLKNGSPVQLISGSFHYYRIHPAYWRDRLLRAQALGLNTIQTYVPWNLHEPTPGKYNWEGYANLTGFLQVAADLGLNVLLRAGPYICGEWDFGGLPWWLAFPGVAGGAKLQLRSTDARFLKLADSWWNVLLPRVAPFLHKNGGPILMVQVENEYGYCGHNREYIRHLLRTARAALGDDVVFYTTDPPSLAEAGSLPGNELYTVVDFGPAADPAEAFKAQAAMNDAGMSPPFCSEFYTGWITHFGEKMANTSADDLVASLQAILQYANGTGSVNFYMAHGGSNWGFWAGSGGTDGDFLPQLTSYDYDAPISEAGGSGQPGIGGKNKFQMIREAISNHTGNALPEEPPLPPAAAFGPVRLTERVSLMDSLPVLAPGDGIPAFKPAAMESYGQQHGVIVYRTVLSVGALIGGGVLDLGEPVHDYAQVMLDGKVVATLERSCPRMVRLPEILVFLSDVTVLEIVVHAMGRNSGGCDWDPKGIVYPNILLNGRVLYNWRVFPIPLSEAPTRLFNSTISTAAASSRHLLGVLHDASLTNQKQHAAQPGGAGVGDAGGDMQPGARDGLEAAQVGRQAAQLGSTGDCKAWPQAGGPVEGPVIFRGYFTVGGSDISERGHPPDTWADIRGWGKGLLWVNGFNLGWYWPLLGPQMRIFVPGPLLHEGSNEILLLEFAQLSDDATVVLEDSPDFFGPGERSGGPAEILT
ncbi:beta-galactosidase [Coccomyxa sp. Obi]|nr:beta-galactosidase [Coccomyxa sp. Obi]